ncbi:hypothetical protein DPMN_158315 [Dreissena polymorpha]|uniref:Uncharacterized protein n=1 Tax=Dreissena polymorpha TaxID=45954 RepID=A0A9D4IPP2_DREPO|nr:hypothetical protein DPMN_158315 [Dreissena polymorpha]
MWFQANHLRSCTGTSRDDPPGYIDMIYSLQLPWMMELRHVTAFGTTTHPHQPHHPVKPEQV